MANEVAEKNEALNEVFVVDTPDKADWALGKLREVNKEIEQNERLAKNNIDRIHDWLDQKNEKSNANKEYFEQILSEYIFTEKQKNPSWKLDTPNGKLSTRKQQPKWNYNDKKLVEELKNTEFLKTEYKVNKKSLKKEAVVKDGKVILPDTGEIIEGVVVEPVSEKAVIKLAEEE